MTLKPRRIAVVATFTATLFGAGLQAIPALAAGLGTPSSLAPNSASTPDKDIVLSWSSVAGATDYKVEISRSDDFSDANDLVELPSPTTPTNSFPVPQTLVHGVYFWRVRAENSATHGGWSTDAEFYRAWDDAPSTTGSNPTSDPTLTPSGIGSYPWRFAWTSLPDASSYEIELSTVQSFPAPGTIEHGKTVDGTTTVVCLTTNTSFTPYDTVNGPDINVDDCDLTSFDPSHTTVYWRVRGIDDSTNPILAAKNQPNQFECVGLSEQADADNTTLAALGTPSSTGQECSRWSSERSVGFFTIGADNGNPGTVSGLTVGCSTGTASDFACTSTPEIAWHPTSGAPEYAVTIADDPSFTNIEHVYRTPFLSLTPRDQLADYTAGSGYYIAVQACSLTADSCGAPSLATFVKRTPKVANLTATKVNGGERLTWQDLNGRYSSSGAGAPAVGAEDYQVEVTDASDADFDSPLVTTTVDAACDATVSTCYAPPATTAAGADQVVVQTPASGRFIWRVSPVDLSGNVLPAASDSTAFVVDSTNPTLHISTRDGVSIQGPITIKASEHVVGMSGGAVHLVPAGGSASDEVDGTVTSAGSNTFTFKPSAPLVTGETYKLTVDPSVQDDAGNPAVVSGGGVRTTTVAANNSKGWTYSNGWKRHAASGARSGSFVESKAGGTASITLAGGGVKLFGCKGPAMGKLKVTIAGQVKTVNEHQAFTQCGVALWHTTLHKGEHVLSIKVTKHHGSIDEVKVS